MSFDQKMGKWLKLQPKVKIFDNQLIQQEVTVHTHSTKLKTIQEKIEEKGDQTGFVQTIVCKYEMDDFDHSYASRKCSSNIQMIHKEMMVLQALNEFHKTISNDAQVSFSPFLPILTSKDYEVEKDIYASMDLIIRKEFRNRSPSSSLGNHKGHIYSLEDIYKMQKQLSRELENIIVKSMIVSLENIILESIEKCYMKYFVDKEGSEKDSALIKVQCGFFEQIHQRYVIMNNVFPFLPKICIENFNEFLEKSNLQCSISELFNDIFWDMVFHIKQINSIFIENYNSDELQEKISHSMLAIMKIFLSFQSPLMKAFCSKLNVLNERENYSDRKYLSQFIIDGFKVDTTELAKIDLGKFSFPLPLSSLINKSNSYKANVDNKSNAQINTIDRSKTQSIPSQSNTQSLDDVYDYIINDQLEKRKRRPKKKKKKATPNPNNDINNINSSSNEENTNTQNSSNAISFNIDDPIVDQFKLELYNDIQKATDVHKIKPIFSTQWINAISSNSS